MATSGPPNWSDDNVTFTTGTNGFSHVTVTSMAPAKKCSRCGTDADLVRAPGHWAGWPHWLCGRCSASQQLRKALEHALDLPRLIVAYLRTR